MSYSGSQEDGKMMQTLLKGDRIFRIWESWVSRSNCPRVSESSARMPASSTDRCTDDGDCADQYPVRDGQKRIRAVLMDMLKITGLAVVAADKKTCVSFYPSLSDQTIDDREHLFEQRQADQQHRYLSRCLHLRCNRCFPIESCLRSRHPIFSRRYGGLCGSGYGCR